MKYLSVCSGIEAATAAWHGLGWEPYAFSEIEPFPSTVLAHHYPNVPNLGDMTKFQEWPDAAIDLLVGGTPCQSFSVAGLRKGLADPRGNLMLTYGAIAAKYRPTWLVWENVPGVLSSNGGKDFGTFLGMLAELGYGFAYRVLDAQYFGVAQRRRRVFVVGYLGDWRRAAAVLFERHSVSGHPAPSREAGKGAARGVEFGPSGGGFTDLNPTLDARCKDGPVRNQLAGAVMHSMAYGGGRTSGPVDIAATLVAKGQKCDFEVETFIAQQSQSEQPYTLAIRGRGDDHNLEYRQDGTSNALLTPNGGRGGIGVGAVAYAVRTANTSANGHGISEDISHTLDQAQGQAIAYRTAGDGSVYEEGDTTAPLTTGTDKSANILAFDTTQVTSKTNYSNPKPGDPCHPLAAGSHPPAIHKEHGMKVRRLTPRECERLQGFPDDYTLIPVRGKPAADGPRYKALGNSMAVPVMAWIGGRINQVSQLIAQQEAA